MNKQPQNGSFILGLDIGANSIGWAIMKVADGEPAGLIKAGSRVFEAGVEGEIESGKDKSRAIERREARSRRRLLKRRAYRLTRLARALQSFGLFPPGELDEPEQRKKFLDALDQKLSQNHSDPAMLPYRLRARALDERLEPHELGRALYHLAQRRGYKSNRKDSAEKKGDDAKKKKEEEGKVKQGIKDLEAEINNAGARTLGEFLSRLDPEQDRVRARYTSRRMYDDEFEAVWNAQAAHRPGLLTQEAKEKIHNAIFFQRPLKNQRNLIGNCELEPSAKRAPIAILPAQRFHMLQKVNDLAVKGVDKLTGEIIARKLTPDERAKLIEKLETDGGATFPQIRKLLGFSGALAECRFNFEESEEKLPGNRTAAKLRKIFAPERWDSLQPAQKDEIVEFLRSARKDHYIEKTAREKWGLDSENAAALASLSLEDGHLSLSRNAIEKLLPIMENGTPFATTRKQIYGDLPAPTPLDLLPPLVTQSSTGRKRSMRSEEKQKMSQHLWKLRRLNSSNIPEIRNPTVYRALTELRKVVNAVIREYGKPDVIRVELARDIKKNRKDRQNIHKRNQANRKAREKAVENLISEAGISNPKGEAIEKWLLAEECEWRCPYTGAQINAASLFGDSPRFDVEHIIPFSRCLDNSFINKTLCEANENRNVKTNKTPFEAYGHQTERWNEIIQRVERFRGDAAKAKRDRFLMKDLADIEGFTTQQLNDTRYASKLAVRYLALLYGGGADGLDPAGRRRVQAGRGQVTKYLRDEWGLNSILGDGGEKSRADHRHHAVDAVCIALTEQRTVKMLSDAASRAPSARRRRFAPLPEPWPGFLRDCKGAIASVNVSHRVSRKANGAIHEQTIYSKPRKDEKGKEFFVVRKKLESFTSAGQIDDIVDPAVRERVRARLAELGGDLKKAFQDSANHPFIETRDGKKIPIHKARVRVSASTLQIGAGPRARNIVTGNNHHVEIFEIKDKKGNIKWEGRMVTVYEAMQRLRKKEPVIDRSHPAGGKFIFSLSRKESIILDDENGSQFFSVRKMSQEKDGPIRVTRVAPNDAKPDSEIKKVSPSINQLRLKNCRKVLITPLGEVIPAND